MNAISYPLKVDNLNLKIEKLFANRQTICGYTATFLSKALDEETLTRRVYGRISLAPRESLYNSDKNQFIQMSCTDVHHLISSASAVYLQITIKMCDMKKNTLSTLFMAITILYGYGNTLDDQICAGDIMLTTQAEVDAFDCTSVEGTLRISGNDIIHLNALGGLRNVGELIIENNPNLDDLSGLSTLDSIGDLGGANLVISNNATLSNLDGLSSLTAIGGSLIISNNAMLRNIDGLSSVSRISSIHIFNNAELENIDGLSGITTESSDIFSYEIKVTDNSELNVCNGLTPLFQSIGVSDVIMLFNYGYIELSGNGAGCTLTDILPGFPFDQKCFRSTTLSTQAEVDAFDCPVVTGTLTISGSDITNLSALSGLRKVGQLVIENNPNLTNLDGLSSLDTIQGSNESSIASLRIRNNALLENIDGLSRLSFMEAHFYTTIEIDNNPSLINVNGLSSLRKFLWVKDGFIVITNNATLSDVNGLSSLRISGPHIPSSLHMDIRSNPLLTYCDLFPLLQSIELSEVGVSGNIRIDENGEGCTLDDILASGPQSIFRFIASNKLNFQAHFFYDSVTLDVADPAFLGWSLQANTFPEKVGSVEFIFPNKNRQLENNLPYIFDIPSRLNLGKNVVQVDVYSQANKKGEKGIGRTATITLINSASVVSFDLVDASGQLIRPLADGDRININDPVFKSIHIRGNTLPKNVSSVKFWLNGQFVRRENGVPYAFNGNNDKGYYPWKPTPGDYTLLAIPYIKHGNREYPGKALTVNFKVEALQTTIAVVGFDVVDTSGKLLKHLNEGDIINLEDPLFKAFNIVANTTGQAGSVNFWLNDKSYRTENNEPYTLAGDQNGKYNAWSPQVREYKLSAIPHAEPNAKGPTGKSLTIHFRVVEEDVSSAYRLSTIDSEDESLLHAGGDQGVWAYPVPVDKELHVKMDDAAGQHAIVVITNIQGLTFYKNSYSMSQIINTSELKPGVYFLQIIGDNGFRKALKIIKE